MALGPLVVVNTEHAGARDSVTLNRLESLRARLGELTRAPVSVTHYLEANRTGIEGQAAVLSGSRSAWAAHDQSELAAFRGRILEFDGRLLGICAGMQLIAAALGGSIGHAASPEHGFVEVELPVKRSVQRALSGGRLLPEPRRRGDRGPRERGGHRPQRRLCAGDPRASSRLVGHPVPSRARRREPSAGERVLANAARLIYRRTDSLMRQGR